jgi:hypothetical protein
MDRMNALQKEKIKLLASFFNIKTLSEIEDAGDISFFVGEKLYYVLTEQERREMAFSILDETHNDEWYATKELAHLLHTTQEDVENHVIAKKILGSKGIYHNEDKMMVRGDTLNEIIYKYMTVPEFIDNFLKTFEQSNEVGEIVSEGEEIIYDGMYIYKELI